MNEIARLYQAFDPLHPLTLAEDNLYVDWQKQLGVDDIKKRLSSSVLNAGVVPVQRLFTGHRGVGKTTELLRVKKILEDQGCFVSMLQAETWLDLADVRAPDLIFNMVQQIASDLHAAGFGFGLQRVSEFVRHILDTEVSLNKFEIKADPVNVGLAFKTPTGARPILRQLIEDRLPTIYSLINDEILATAREWLAKERNCHSIVLIVDELDRTPLRLLDADLHVTNHESLFLHSAGVLRSLNCHVIYTIPIELAYSRARIRLRDVYGHEFYTLPVIAVSERGRKDNEPGLNAMRSMIEQRANGTAVFESPELCDRFCRLSGGHVRTLFTLLRSALDRTETLPITESIAAKTILRASEDVRMALQQKDWAVLHEVHSRKEKSDKEEFDLLVRNLYIFYYQDEQGDWYDWNPLLADVAQ